MADTVIPEDPPKRLMFDAAVMELLRQTIVEIFLKHGDTVRSIGVFVDYHGELNDANINKGVWLGAEGTVSDPAAIVGSGLVCTHLLQKILNRNMQLQARLREELQIVLTEVEKGYSELEAQKKEADGASAS